VSPFHASEHVDIVSVFPSVHVAGDGTALYTEIVVESVCPSSIKSPPQPYTHQHASKKQQQTSVIFTAMRVTCNKQLQCSQINIPARYITQTDTLTRNSQRLKTLHLTLIQYISNVALYTCIRCDTVFIINRH
jgi:ABC-type antimicrobial peptide transport system ATPase subunit